VLTTHYLDEADSMAERVIVVDHGRIIADDTPARLKAEHVGDRIMLGFDSRGRRGGRPPSRRRDRSRTARSEDPHPGPGRGRCPGCSRTCAPPASRRPSVEVPGRRSTTSSSAHRPQPARGRRGRESADDRELVEV
jgi:energy-coupling factor transporter ATP-binding protein EcfA2